MKEESSRAGSRDMTWRVSVAGASWDKEGGSHKANAARVFTQFTEPTGLEPQFQLREARRQKAVPFRSGVYGVRSPLVKSG